MSRAPRPHGAAPRARTASQRPSDVVLGAAELDAGLARVPGAGDHDLDPVELAHLVREGGLLGEAESLEGARALHGDEAVLVGGVAYLASAWLALLQPLVDRTPVRGVADHEVLAVRESVDDEVVDDPALLVREQRVLRFAVRDLVEIVREHLLEERVRGGAVDVDVAHVRDVEGAAVGPNGPVLLDDAPVLDGHLEAGERHHPRTERHVARVERRARERRGLHAQESIRSRRAHCEDAAREHR